MRKLLWAGALSLLLVACASTPPSSEYLSTLNNQDIKTTLSSFVPPDHAPLLTTGGVKSELDENDGTIQLNGYGSYYKVFELQESGAKQFEVNAVCSCLGFDKRILVPALYLFSAQGKLVPATSTKYKITPPSGFTPMRLTLDARVDAGNPKYILVAADNSNPDSTVESIVVKELPGGSPVLNLQIRSYPVGKFQLSYSQ